MYIYICGSLPFDCCQNNHHRIPVRRQCAQQCAPMRLNSAPPEASQQCAPQCAPPVRPLSQK